MTETTTYQATLERYVRFWNATTPDEQHRLAAETFVEDVEYHAPVGILTGAAALIDFHDQFIQHMGTAVFRGRDEPQLHHDRARFAWEIQVGGEGQFAAGTDVLAFTADGRIGSISSFLDRAPEGFDPTAHH